MDIETAKKITGECIKNMYAGMGIGEDQDNPPDLTSYELDELLEANHTVRDDKDCHQMMCDDRLVAALYTLYHYEAESENIDPIIRVGDKALICLLITPEMIKADEG